MIEVGGDLRLVYDKFGSKHRQSHRCPGCGADMNRVAVVSLVYAFTACECTLMDYRHLYEQLWHRSCFLKGNVE